MMMSRIVSLTAALIIGLSFTQAALAQDPAPDLAGGPNEQKQNNGTQKNAPKAQMTRPQNSARTRRSTPGKTGRRRNRQARCYAWVKSPARYKTVQVKVPIETRRQRVTTAPVRYEWERERVLVAPEQVTFKDHPPRYKTVYETVLAEPASRSVHRIPPIYKRMTREIPVYPHWRGGHDMHRRGHHGPVAYETYTTIFEYQRQKVIIEVRPERYETVAREIEIAPAWRERVVSPARYRWVKRRVMAAPERRRTADRRVRYRIEKKRVTVKVATVEWRRVPGPGC